MFGGCLGGSIGIDDDWDVNIGASVGTGTPGVSAEGTFNPSGDYEDGFDASVGASCSYGYATVGYNAVSDEGYGTVGTSVSTGTCSASAGLGYTF